MKVLIWNTNYTRDGGGSQKVTYFLASGLTRLGFQITVACNQVGKHMKNPAFGDLPSEVKVYRDGFSNPWEFPQQSISFSSQIFTYLKASLRFFSFLRKEHFLLVHLNYVSWDIALLGLAKFLFGFPLVISFLGGETNLAPQKKLTKIKMGIALRVADRVTAVSTSLCDELRDNFGFLDVVHIPFYIDSSQRITSAFSLSSPVEADHFVFCGRISPEKRVPFLIESFREAILQGCFKKLYIIGEGADLSKSRQLVQTYKLQDQIIFLGLLPYQQAQQIISKSRCLILCSHTESNPQVVLEAMSFEKPVICSAIPGVKQIVIHGETGLLFEITRKDRLVKSILRVSADDEYAQKLGYAGGLHLKSLFAKQDYVKRMVELYSELTVIDDYHAR